MAHLRSRKTTKLEVDSGGDCSPIRRRQLEKRQESDHVPFWKLLMQVGLVVACLLLIAWNVYRSVVPVVVVSSEEYTGFDDDTVYTAFDSSSEPNNMLNEGDSSERFVPHEADYDFDHRHTTTTAPTAAPKHWELGRQSQHDAYAHAQPSDTNLFWQTAQGLRDQFANLYGGERAARVVLEQATTVFNVNHTACRIQDAVTNKRPFTISFGGYSVTTGRGNYHLQSYPNVLERQLTTIFELAGTTLRVRNAAIGGVPSFPYGWCMDAFFGEDVDVLSWDFSMNEAGGDPTGLEAYLRHALHRKKHPMVIVKDTHLAVQRRELIERYQDTLLDPIIVHTDPATDYFLSLPELERPPGFQAWRQFGAPHGAPGQSGHHPGVKEHEFIAWVLAMHFLNALEIVVQSTRLECRPQNRPQPLHPPNGTTAATPWQSLLYGEEGGDNIWKMNTIGCRTSYDPIVKGNLSDSVVSGGVGQELNVMLPKSKMYYNKGWVLDLSDPEKQAKRNLDRFGGLGYVDAKRAYYGIFASGTLSLFLPYEKQLLPSPDIHSRASDFFKSIVVCEVNEQRGSGACNSIQDVRYTVGEANATKVSAIDAGGALYLGKKICLHVVVPDTARLSCAKLDAHGRYDLVESQECDQVGVTLGINVINRHINRRDDACSVSHVVWEQVEPEVMAQQ